MTLTGSQRTSYEDALSIAALTHPMTTKAPSVKAPTQSTFFYMNVLRAYASVMVVLFHAYSMSVSMDHIDPALHTEAPLWWYSVIDLFFVMSGFLMVHMSRKLYGNWKGVRTFAAKRMVRTPPLYWVYTIITAGIFLVIAADPTKPEHVTLWRFFASMIFLPIVGGPIILLGWTLNMEVFFYALFGLTVKLKFPIGPIICATLLVLIVCLGRVFPFENYVLKVWTDPLFLDFIWGLALAIIYHYGIRLSPLIRIILVLLAAVVLGMVTVFGYDAVLAPFNYIRPLIFGFSAACLVAAATLRDHDKAPGKIGSFVNTLSNSAYTLYLSHIITLKAVQIIYLKFGMVAIFGTLPFIIFGSIVAVAAGYVAYLLLEKPFDAYLRNRLLSKRSPVNTKLAGEANAPP